MTIFFKILADMVECYVEDLVVKSHQRIDHLEYLGSYKISSTITPDNDQPFRSATLYKLYAKYKIKRPLLMVLPARRRINQGVHKTLYIFLEKMVDKNKKTWSDKLLESLCAYRTMVRP